MGGAAWHTPSSGGVAFFPLLLRAVPSFGWSCSLPGGASLTLRPLGWFFFSFAGNQILPKEEEEAMQQPHPTGR